MEKQQPSIGLSDREKLTQLKALAASIAPNLRRQIVQMYNRDQVPIPDIAQMLQLSELIIHAVIYCAAPPATAATAELPAVKTRDEVDNEYEELLARSRSMESRLADAEYDAVNTLVELNESSESEAVRYNAAKTILEIRAGKLRPERPDRHASRGITPQDMQEFIKQAMAVHAATTAGIKNAQATPIVDLQAVEITEPTP